MMVNANLWQLVRVKEETGGIWRRISSLTPRALVAGELNIWTALGNRPGGMWQDLSNETLLISRPARANIWTEVNDETLIIRPRRDIWRSLPEPPVSERHGLGIWSEVGGQTLLLPPPGESTWSAVLASRDITRLKPERRLGWALKKLATASGDPYFVLKNTRTGSYLRLTEPQVFLWNLMDGLTSIRDMAVAYFIQYHSLAIDGLLTFLSQLNARGFLVEGQSNLYASTAHRLGQFTLKSQLGGIWRYLTGSSLIIQRMDRFFTALYRAGGFLLFTRPAQWIILLVTIAGLAVFVYQLLAGSYSVLRGGGQNYALGLIGLYGAQFLALFIHEFSHALACKSYGREVRRAGFAFYLGMPSFFVDTTDIWMEQRKPRLLVSWAGPYSGFFLAGLASLLGLAVADPFFGGLCYQFAFASCLISFTNLNPLLQLDGYYLLMDYLEMPMLRARALSFAQGELWRKLKRKAAFNREERIFAIFGLLSLGWTVGALLTTIGVTGRSMLSVFQGWLGTIPGLILAALLTLLFGLLLLWPFLTGGLKYLTVKRTRPV